MECYATRLQVTVVPQYVVSVGMWAAERVVLVNVCTVPECVAVFMREVMWAIQCPDSWFTMIMLMFHGNAILFTISH